jgi:hypothetical protein
MYLKMNMLQICNKRYFSVCMSDKLIYLWRLLSSKKEYRILSRSFLTFQRFIQPPLPPPAVCLSTLVMEAVVSSETYVQFHQTASPHVSKTAIFILACEKIKYLLIRPCFHESLINPNVHDKLNWKLVGLFRNYYRRSGTRRLTLLLKYVFIHTFIFFQKECIC